MAKVLCVVAHPDDEVLGCGGALAKHAEEGDEVHAFVVCWRRNNFQKRDLRADAVRAAETLGTRVITSGFCADQEPKDQEFDLFPLSKMAFWIELLLGKNPSPDIIYTHHPADLNLDHALTSRAVLTAFRPKPGEKPRTILACEILSSTEYTYPPAFQPNWYVGLSGEQLQKKVDALACYESEVKPWPHPRSALGVRNLAAYRGQSVGVEAAEAFQLLRGGPF